MTTMPRKCENSWKKWYLEPFVKEVNNLGTSECPNGAYTFSCNLSSLRLILSATVCPQIENYSFMNKGGFHLICVL